MSYQDLLYLIDLSISVVFRSTIRSAGSFWRHYNDQWVKVGLIKQSFSQIRCGKHNEPSGQFTLITKSIRFSFNRFNLEVNPFDFIGTDSIFTAIDAPKTMTLKSFGKMVKQRLSDPTSHWHLLSITLLLHPIP